MPASSTPSVTDLVTRALTELGADAPTSQSLMRIAVVLATAVNKAAMKGADKQVLVLAALREVLATPVIADRLDTAAKAVLADVVDTIIPQTLALVVEAGRSGALKKPTVGCVGSFLALFCRSAASVAVKAGAPQEVGQALAVSAEMVTPVVVAVGTVLEAQAEEPIAPAAQFQVQPEQTSASADSSQPPSTDQVEQ